MFERLMMRPAAIALAVVLAVAGTAATAQAQETTARPNAVGAGGATQAPSDGSIALDDAQRAAINDLNGYFNEITHLEGDFVQTDAQGQRAVGRFFVQRPGKFRFVYAPPSRLVILSDGTFLAIEDYDLDTVERYSLDSTPFRILLSANVDMVRDAIITDVALAGPLTSIALRDRKNQSSGKLRITVEKTADGIALREWVVTDAQG
ncbi:MAG: outer membrane lipoprotein carrier protein LolA, partial [Pseudomonadota bacterium]